MKVCKGCKEEKELTEFAKTKNSKDGLRGGCKSCEAKRKKDADRTKEGKLKSIYRNQLKHSKLRGHNPPTYTKQEFIDKYINNQRYLTLYINWVSSGYLKELSPSFDRLDDYKGYSFDNIQVITWFENNEKGYLDIKEGRNNKQSKAVIGTNIKTGETIEFYSAHQAGRCGFTNTHISSCCRGERNHHKGYIWKFKN